MVVIFLSSFACHKTERREKRGSGIIMKIMIERRVVNGRKTGYEGSRSQWLH